MLVIDFSGTIYASVLKQMYMDKDWEFDENLTRHSVLSSLRRYKNKFPGYGKTILACDSKNYWRKDIFPYYKSNRKTKQDADQKINWSVVFSFIDKIKEELKVNLPWTVLEIPKAEADDIIAYLALKSNDRIMIVSRDGDLIQLQRLRIDGTIQQYNPVEDRLETDLNLDKFLFEHICRGDKGDGIPNIASPDNAIAVGTRQTPITQKKLDLWFDEKKVPEAYQSRFTMNRRLIDLRLIPQNIKDTIEESLSQRINNKIEMIDLMKYFKDHDLKEMKTSIGDFF